MAVSREESMASLLRRVRNCDLCKASLPSGPRPVLQIDSQARILIAGQAPGRRVHESGIPFDDPSGKRLRDWMGIDSDVFYNATQIAILPMGFCYPGTGKSGDLPPRPECAATWRDELLNRMPELQLTLVIGRYAQEWHLPSLPRTLTETVAAWQDYAPSIIPLPHPSPRNNRWLKTNPWFEEKLIPVVRQLVAAAQ